MKKKVFIFVFAICMLMTGCGNKNTVASTDTYGMNEDGEIRYVVIDNEVDTASSLKTSYTDSVKDYDMVVYFGHPRTLDGTAQWTSEDISILSVNSNNEAAAWKEGTVKITNGTETRTVLCTTYNDDKEYEFCSLSDEEIMELADDIVCPEYIASKINTVRDLQRYFITAGYSLKDIGINATHNWTWAINPGSVVENRGGVCQDFVSFAVYMLQHDYEDVGVVYVCGEGVGYAYNYVYENGQYLIFDLDQLAAGRQLEESEWNIVSDLEDYKEAALAKLPQEYVLCIFTISADNKPDISPVYMSYMQDYYCLDRNAVIGVEKGTKYKILYRRPNDNFTFEEREVYPGVKAWYSKSMDGFEY